MKKAKDFLVAAYWNTVKNSSIKQDEKKDAHIDEEVVKENQSLRHKAFARLHEEQGEFSKAIEELAQAIYLDSLNTYTYGPENPILCSSYFMMGNLLRKVSPQEFGGGKRSNNEDSMTKAIRFYDLVVKIWYSISKMYCEIKDGFRKKPYLVDILTRKEGEKVLMKLRSNH